MKTTLKIDIESKDSYCVRYDEADLVGEEEQQPTKKNLSAFRKEYARMLHTAVVEAVKEAVKLDAESFFEGIGQEVYMEGWDELKDYDIKIRMRS
jgi:hypothetical protein